MYSEKYTYNIRKIYEKYSDRCSSCSALQKPSTMPSFTCIDLLLGGSCMLYMGGILYSLFYMCSSSISYMLTGACCGCIGSSKSWYLLCRSSSVADLFCQDQTHHHCHVHYHAYPSESHHIRNVFTVTFGKCNVF